MIQLLADYRLIAFDLPGHGESDAALDPANEYSVQALGKTMAEAVVLLRNGHIFALAGLSLGTNIVAEMLAFMETPAGIILAGADVMGSDITLDKAMLPDADSGLLFMDMAEPIAVRRYANSAAISAGESAVQLIIDDYFRVKPPFRSELLKTALAGKFSDEIMLLEKTGLPVLLIFGAEECFLDTSYLDAATFLRWKNTTIKIPKASHFVNLDQPKLFNEAVAMYLKEMFVK